MSLRDEIGVEVTLSFGITALFVVAAALLFATVMLLVHKGYRRWYRYTPMVTAVAWLLWELLHNLIWFDLAFPWLQIGYAFVDTWLAGWASLGSVTLVSLVVLFVVVGLFQLRRTPILSAALVGLPWILGLLLLQINWTQPKESKTVALVQGNYTMQEKMQGYQDPSGMFQTYVNMSAGIEKADLVVWPEAAVTAFSTKANISRLQETADLLDMVLLTGIFDSGDTRENGEVVSAYNAALGFVPEGSNYERYRKIKLVPFGEYVPLRTVLKPLLDALGLPASILVSANTRPEIMNIADMKLAIAICYEIAFPNYVARTSRDSSFIVTMSEDGWFGNSMGLWQHMQIARMRSLESGRYLIRSTTSGITVVVDPKGKVINSLPQHTRAVLMEDIQIMEGITPYLFLHRITFGWYLYVMMVVVVALPFLLSQIPVRDPKYSDQLKKSGS